MAIQRFNHYTEGPNSGMVDEEDGLWMYHDDHLAALREHREGIITKIKERLAHCRKTGAEHAEPGLYAALGIVRAYDGGGEEEATP